MRVRWHGRAQVWSDNLMGYVHWCRRRCHLRGMHTGVTGETRVCSRILHHEKISLQTLEDAHVRSN